RLIEESHLVPPPHVVLAAIPPWVPAAAARREVHRPAGLEQLLRDLAARLSRADDQDRSFAQLRGAPIDVAVHLLHARVDRARRRRDRRPLIRPRPDADVLP